MQKSPLLDFLSLYEGGICLTMYEYPSIICKDMYEYSYIC